jgi:hypothetical protein
MGHNQLKAYFDEQAQKVDDDVREAIEIAGGNVTRALRATLIANAFLIEENEKLKTQISQGFTRGKNPKARRPGQAGDSA